MNKFITFLLYTIILVVAFNSCSSNNNNVEVKNSLPSNVLNYNGTPNSYSDRGQLAFSDQGAWFAYSFSDNKKYFGGFSGPFLMTQENGIWAGPSLSYLKFEYAEKNKLFDWDNFTKIQNAYASHMEQNFISKELSVFQSIYFLSPHTAITKTIIKNSSDQIVKLRSTLNGNLLTNNLSFQKSTQSIIIRSSKSEATGVIKIYHKDTIEFIIGDSSFTSTPIDFILAPNESREICISHTFTFPNYSLEKELEETKKNVLNYNQGLQKRIYEKETQLESIVNKTNSIWRDSTYRNITTKCLLTLQNNWRIPAGELKHSGLFPSYHYIWFHGFWAWDSWKHAAALAQFDPELAKNQVRSMFDFQNENGFIADCVYRDTTIENHNYRNTKPPLSAWAVWKIFEQDNDYQFLAEIFPKIVKQHDWWYSERDHDRDSLCEYGSTDGTLIAAKWESGMDNAVRFDNSKIVYNSAAAFSLNQESVDLNSYLYAEKLFLSKIAESLGLNSDSKYLSDSEILKTKIQNQFFDMSTGWFYDTSLDGNEFIKDMGCEGWIPIWANVANKEQALAIKENIVNPKYFNTSVPLQTLSADHPKFEPNGGYWRGPNWLDQAYFGIKGLLNYGFNDDAKKLAKKILINSKGVLGKGKSIRENYNPITGEGLESESFSWSAAHILLLLLEEY